MKNNNEKNNNNNVKNNAKSDFLGSEFLKYQILQD